MNTSIGVAIVVVPFFVVVITLTSPSKASIVPSGLQCGPQLQLFGVVISAEKLYSAPVTTSRTMIDELPPPLAGYRSKATLVPSSEQLGSKLGPGANNAGVPTAPVAESTETM